MKKCFLLLLVSIPSYLLAQYNGQPTTPTVNLRLGDKSNNQYKLSPVRRNFLVPVALIGTGLYVTKDKSIINRYEIKEERDEYFPKFRHRLDDYIQYLPIVSVYGLNAMGVKGKHDLANSTVLLIKSEIIVTLLTTSIKRVAAVPRPDTGQPNSFPSGHTAQAFAAATFMVKEYGDKNIWYSIGAYTVATGVGACRILNNRHWISDVIAGAGVGILSTNLAYMTHRYKWQKGKENASTWVVPAFDGRTASVCILKMI